MGKGKKWNFPGGEKRKLAGILPELHTILRVKKLKTLFLSKISGGEKSMSGGELSPPALRKKKPCVYGVTFSIQLIKYNHAEKMTRYFMTDEKYAIR